MLEQDAPDLGVALVAQPSRGAKAHEATFQPRDHPPLLLSQALMLLAGEWTNSGVVRRLNPALVLAEAWAPHWLTRCRERLAAGEQAPPINVIGFRLGPRLVLYGVSDGMHRTVAHHEAGKTIKARIGGYYPVKPERFVLWRDHLWRREDAGLRMEGIGDLSEDLRPVLLALGVEPRGSPEVETV